MCPCGGGCAAVVDMSLLHKLEILREKTGAITITSGFRCQKYQDSLKAAGYETAAGVSQHTLGMAADLHVPGLTGLELEKLARGVGFMAVGIGSTWVHVDERSDKIRRWEYLR